MSKTNDLKTVDEYFDNQPLETKNALLAIKKCILKVNPETTELFNYNIPSYTLIKGGKREQQIMMAGYKKHIGFYPHPSTIEKFDKELNEYKKGKGSVQFPLNKALPLDLIEKMVRYRMKLVNA